MNRKIFQLSSIFLSLFVVLLTSSTKVEAKKDCNKLFPHPWQLPDRQRCHAENKGAELAEEAWGEAGRGIYTSASAIMSKRSPTGVSLDSSLKDALRPHFGSLVDRVTIHWGTPALDTWADSRYSIRLSDTDSAGQTYGHDIYIAQQKPSSYSPSLVHLVTHELVHSEQYERYGSSLSNFGYHYFKKYKQAGQSYHNNQLEKEAEEKANRIYREVHASIGTFKNFKSFANAGGKCLDVHLPDMRNNGGKVQVWDCNGQPQQQWSLRGNEFVNAGGMCLDVHQPDMRNNGGRVQVWQCNGEPQQQWSLRGNALVNAGGKCLDVHQPDMRNNGGRVQVWDCGGSPQQQWRF